MTTLAIVIPTTGRATLDRAIRSAEAAADQVIVINDPDGRYGAPGLARNAAIPQVTTEWVGFCDDDDVLVSDVYRSTIDGLADGADLILQTMLDANGCPVPVPGEKVTHGNVGISFALRSELWRANPFIAGPPHTFRGEDYELFRRIVDQGHRVVLSRHVAYLASPKEQP